MKYLLYNRVSTNDYKTDLEYLCMLNKTGGYTAGYTLIKNRIFT